MAISRLVPTQAHTTMSATPRRPRPLWEGRDKRRVAEAVPAQTLEIVRSSRERLAGADHATTPLWEGDARTPRNRLIWTNDNLVALTSLLAGDEEHEPLEGKVDLIYIDPPFAVQSNFSINVEIEDGISDEKLPTLIEQLAYEDTWKDGLDSYLSMMRDRLELLKRLLAPTGSIYVHCDWHAGHYLKVLMDEVFGYETFQSEITWKRTTAHSSAERYAPIHDTIFFYGASDAFGWNAPRTGYADEYLNKYYHFDDGDGRLYWRADLCAAGTRKGKSGMPWRGIDPAAKGMHWKFGGDDLEELDRQGRIYWPKTGIMPQYKRYREELKGKALADIWDDIDRINPVGSERIGFPTQKPVALLQRIIAASSNPGDLVLDAFGGSGTTAVAAETMKDSDGKPAPRRWITMDCGKFAVHITRKRLIEAQASPFTVENIGFYSRADVAWWANQGRCRFGDLVRYVESRPVEGA